MVEIGDLLVLKGPVMIILDERIVILIIRVGDSLTFCLETN